MFKTFKSNFTEFSTIANPLFNMKDIPFKYKELLLDCGGKSYDNGLYSIHTFEDSVKWTGLLYQYFEKFKDAILSFGHDWKGRQFCVPIRTGECIYMFDPASQGDYYFEENLLDFHNNTLPNTKVENLDADIFEQVLNHLGIKSIEYHNCIGFNTPLFLNGKEELDNYKVIDLEVYWDIEYQLYQQASKLPPGTRISGVNINPF